MAEMALQRDHVLGIDTPSTLCSVFTSDLDPLSGLDSGEVRERRPLIEDIRRVNGVYDKMEPVLKFERDGAA